jgi:DNA-binding response OmpR family regulator
MGGQMTEHTSGKSVLIVEDDDDVRGALAAFLEAEGYRVREASDGAAALRELRAGSVGLVLLDLWMPGMNGWEFRAEQVKDVTLADVPVVVITADQAAARRATALGVSGCMTKPIEFPELLAHVARYC